MKDVAVIGTMVVCESCKKAIWALDSDCGDARGFANLCKLPCPNCGDARGTFDGWRVTTETQKVLGMYDAWSTMEKLAQMNGYEWEPSVNCVWSLDVWLQQQMRKLADN